MSGSHRSPLPSLEEREISGMVRPGIFNTTEWFPKLLFRKCMCVYNFIDMPITVLVNSVFICRVFSIRLVIFCVIMCFLAYCNLSALIPIE